MFRKRPDNMSEATLTALDKSLAVIEFDMDGIVTGPTRSSST